MVQQLLDASALSGMECQGGQRQILSLHNRNSQWISQMRSVSMLLRNAERRQDANAMQPGLVAGSCPRCTAVCSAGVPSTHPGLGVVITQAIGCTIGPLQECTDAGIALCHKRAFIEQGSCLGKGSEVNVHLGSAQTVQLGNGLAKEALIHCTNNVRHAVSLKLTMSAHTSFTGQAGTCCMGDASMHGRSTWQWDECSGRRGSQRSMISMQGTAAACTQARHNVLLMQGQCCSLMPACTGMSNCSKQMQIQLMRHGRLTCSVHMPQGTTGAAVHQAQYWW